MKRGLSLEKTWDECLRMWKWIIETLEEDIHYARPTIEREWVVYSMKSGWMRLHHLKARIEHNCLFCEYNEQRGGISSPTNGNCSHCPGRLVDPMFNCETDLDWQKQPKEFYEALKRLDRIRHRRLAKKRKV